MWKSISSGKVIVALMLVGAYLVTPVMTLGGAVRTMSPCDTGNYWVRGTVVDGVGEAAAGIGVVLVIDPSLTGEEQVFGSVTNSGGDFAIRVPHEPGSSRLIANAPDYSSVSAYSNRRFGIGTLAVTVRAGLPVQTVVLPPNHRGIGGRVLGPGSIPLDRARITILGGEVALDTVSDRRGEFSVTGLPAGWYWVQGTHALFKASSAAQALVGAGDSLTPIELTLGEHWKACDRSTGRVSGVVIDSAWGSRLVSGEVHLTPFSGQASAPSYSVEVDAEGCFAFPEIRSGKYTLTYALIGYSSGRQGLEVTDGKEMFITMRPGAVAVAQSGDHPIRLDLLKGRVLDQATREGIQGAVVLLGPKPNWYFASLAALTDTAGRFRFPPLWVDDYFLTAVCRTRRVVRSVQLRQGPADVTVDLP